jgi:GrpB-like predicted nucleotidyltransferase (UPF0157 family)
MRKVEVVGYDAAWPGMAVLDIERIIECCKGVFCALEHIGSTAVPGLSARPIIDLLGEVSSITAIDAHNEALGRLGYHAMGEYGIPARRYYYRGDDEVHTSHLHVFSTGSQHLFRHRVLRGYLIAYPGQAQEYGQLKLELAKRFRNNIEGYVAGKDAFVRALEQKAIGWESGC